MVNLATWGALSVCQGAAGPLLGGVTTLAINRAGGGLIALPASGWGWAISLVVYFVAMDFGEYLFHRAQHLIPALWAMHSLHHSDPDFDATTAARHFWLEPAIKMVTIWLAVAVVFKTPPSVAMVYILVSYWHFVVHSNSRLDFGPLSWALNGPAYHRLHHSRLAEHFDLNFASLFPIFDVMAGSYRRPTPGEAVPTGLDTGDAPQTAWHAIAWPFRGRLAKPKGAPLPSPQVG